VTSAAVRAVLLDIEGTTTPLTFVHDVLFPYARRRLKDYLRDMRDAPETGEVARLLTAEHAADLIRAERPPALISGRDDDALASLAIYAEWLMDRDRKSPGLKLLQGLIWQRGYQDGVLRGQVFPDVPAAIRRWRAAGTDVAIYSSGSELAQRLLFASTPQGDLTPLLCGFFDTRVGPKTSADSYRRIAGALGRQPDEILFISDSPAELDAARAAGLQVVQAQDGGSVFQRFV
jgi:enolase-phosphatase E1